MSNLMLFLFMYLMSFMLVMNSDDWFLIWLGLEINMMMFIVIVYERCNIFNIESCLKYFFIQSMGSAILMSFLYVGKEYLDMMVCLIMTYKIGGGPFFFWFPSLCKGISWMSCFILMCFQKIIPLILVSLFMSFIMFLMVLVSLFFGVLGSFNQKDLSELIAYSSVYHLGWLFLLSMSGDIFWMFYLLMYMMMLYPVVFFFNKGLVNNLLGVVKVSSKKCFLVCMLSMAGMPPFLGFFLKWFAFLNIFQKSFFFSLLLVFSSVVMFYVYFRVIYDVLMVYHDHGMWSNWVLSKNYFFMDMMSVLGVILGLLLVMMCKN